MNGNDWNGNEHRDSFDKYIDYKVSNSDGIHKSVSGTQFGWGWGALGSLAFLFAKFIST